MNYLKTVTLAITGASGAQYGLRLLQSLLEARCRVYLLISAAAEVVIQTETQITLPSGYDAQQQFLASKFAADEDQLQVFGRDDWFSPVASGSSASAAMVVCPASGGTLSAIACGASNNLIERAADVALKERRQLILVPREAPYSEVHLQNMLSLTRMGAMIIPASPGFYHQPQCIDDLVNFIVARILDQLAVPHSLMQPWGHKPEA